MTTTYQTLKPRTSAMDEANILGHAQSIALRELGPKWEVKINRRFRGLKGRCHADRRLIEMADHCESFTDLELTVLHEVAHAKTIEAIFMMSPREAQKARQAFQWHGATWKLVYAELLKRYGYQPERIDRFA